MRFSFPVGRVFGTQIRIHSTLVLLLLWVFVDEALATSYAFAGRNVLLMALVFCSVLLHEFGHVGAARKYGIRTPDITLLPIGGMARLERIPEEPKQEIFVALAGPAVSALLGFCLWSAEGFPALHLEGTLEEGGQMFATLAAVNFGLLTFNLLPAFPMDGGRVLRACLSLRLPYIRATEWASNIGKCIAAGLFAAAMVIPLPMLSILAVFLYLSAGRECAMATNRQRERDSLPSCEGAE
jgi:Zn-dependent protease